MRLIDHPTVRRVREGRGTARGRGESTPVDAGWLKQLARDCGADDVGLVEISRPELDDQRNDILRFFPAARTLLALVCRMNREPIRSQVRLVANAEFHHTGDEVNEISRAIVSALEQKGIRAVNPTMGFPMEMDRFPGKVWVVGHKPVAVAAGLGRMGIHRNVIHPRFGNFILPGTILVDAAVTAYDQPIDYNPCLECKLCVAACPVGAISLDGHFDFSACYTHNYREFMGGFNDWVEQIADSRNALDYRSKVTGSETSSMWQSFSFGANYKAAYCLSVCPAGEDVIRPFLDDRAGFLSEVVRPLQDKEETPVNLVAECHGPITMLRMRLRRLMLIVLYVAVILALMMPAIRTPWPENAAIIFVTAIAVPIAMAVLPALILRPGPHRDGAELVPKQFVGPWKGHKSKKGTRLPSILRYTFYWCLSCGARCKQLLTDQWENAMNPVNDRHYSLWNFREWLRTQCVRAAKKVRFLK